MGEGGGNCGEGVRALVSESEGVKALVSAFVFCGFRIWVFLVSKLGLAVSESGGGLESGSIHHWGDWGVALSQGGAIHGPNPTSCQFAKSLRSPILSTWTLPC